MKISVILLAIGLAFSTMASSASITDSIATEPVKVEAIRDTLDVQTSKKVKTEVDSVKMKELPVLSVKGENVWFEKGKAVFVPSRQDKNLSKNMTDLIEMMQTGVLYVEGGMIKAGGNKANIYINGVPVDNMDQATFWAKNALRVEYYPVSDDPRFGGKNNIVNFIMKEYKTGGLTRLDGSQTFPNTGSYTASSKLVYKDMTYNGMVRAGYNRDHSICTIGTENYLDVWTTDKVKI